MRNRWVARMSLLGFVVAGFAGSALAAVGAGKVVATFIALPSTPGRKALGKVTVTPKDFKAGGPPQGGIYKFKFAANTGDPLKPGLAPGRYILEVDAAPGPGFSPGVETFVTFTVGPDNKCTFDPNSTVIPPDGGIPGPGGCGGSGEPLCDGPHVGKCEFTQYQAAGTFLYGAAGDASPLLFVMRVRALAAAHDVGGGQGLCETGLLDLSGDDDPTGPCVGGVLPNATPNPVIAIMGIAAGADDNP
jgi:hypothetical protein